VPPASTVSCGTAWSRSVRNGRLGLWKPEEAWPVLAEDRPRYMISIAAELVGMHPQTLRVYEAKGLVRPKRTPGNTRLYSDADLERLRLIQRLTGELGLNLAGVETVIRLEDELARLRNRVNRLERELREEVARVHRQYRREIVLYREPGQTLPDRKQRWTSTG
jgi:MerR family transcriptional regulator/heat shock protein HspR